MTVGSAALGAVTPVADMYVRFFKHRRIGTDRGWGWDRMGVGFSVGIDRNNCRVCYEEVVVVV